MVPRNESNTTTDAISDFLQTIRSLSVLSDRQFEKLEARLAHGGYPTDPTEVASGLVKEGILTEFQARQIQKGKARSLIFGRYLILDFLGKGTMGRVYKAKHRMMGRVAALKILDSRYLSSTRSVARFHREMQLVGRLDHPNVVRAFDADRIEDCYFIAMEYAPGQTLQDLLKARGALPPADVIYFASQAAAGLGHAHERGVIHRDIKPSNLLLTEGRTVKVLDFGLGTLLEKEELPAELTAQGITVGTPDYLSPEQARMVKIDGRSDLYSLGCTMYHLMSGKLPFKGESSMDCIVGRITGQAVPISEVRPGLPPRVIQAIEKLMATNPDDRYQTAAEAAAALRSLLRPKGVGPSASPPTEAPIVPVPAPVPVAGTTRETPSLPVRAGDRVSKPKRDTLGSPRTGRRIKSTHVLAAIAVAAVALSFVTIVLIRSSNDERPVAEPANLQSNNVPVLPSAGTDTLKKPVLPARGADVNKGRALPTDGAEVRRSSLVIETPTEGATVGMREELTGRVEFEGWPVLFVQADIPGQPWWCQAPVLKVDGGRFTTKIVFGDDFTPSGTRFRIAGIVARSREEALNFDTGSKEQNLPEGYPRSGVVVVTHR